MAWEKRERGGTYYTRAHREGGRVVREYIGGGEFGELLAAFDEEDRRQARITRAIEEDERECLAEPDGLLALLEALTDAALRQALTEAGYHQHKRGEWRKRRGSKQQDRTEAGGSEPGTGRSIGAEPTDNRRDLCGDPESAQR